MEIRIETLRLRAAGLGEEPARRLAGLIAERLSAALPGAAPPGAAGLDGLGRLEITLQAGAEGTLDDLADGAAAEILRAVSPAGDPAPVRARGAAPVPGTAP